MQSRKRSLIEASVITVLGMSYAVPLNYVMIHQMTWSDPWVQSFWMVVVFMVISLAFKYCIRRYFNWLDHHRPTAHSSTSGKIVSADGKMKIDFSNHRIEVTGEPRPKSWAEHMADKDSQAHFGQEPEICECCGQYK